MFVLKKFFFPTHCTVVKKGVTLISPIRTLYRRSMTGRKSSAISV